MSCLCVIKSDLVFEEHGVSFCNTGSAYLKFNSKLINKCITDSDILNKYNSNVINEIDLVVSLDDYEINYLLYCLEENDEYFISIGDLENDEKMVVLEFLAKKYLKEGV